MSCWNEIPRRDKEILQELGRQVAEIATSPVNEEYKERQRRINDLETVKPIIYIYEIPWHEMNVNDELTMRTKHPLCRRFEGRLRRIIYKWKHKLGVPVDDPRFDYTGLDPVIVQPL